MERGNAAGIMFSTGMLMLILPPIVYDLDASALNTISWIGIATVLLSLAVDIPLARTKGDASEPPPTKSGS
jgi:hypothetical protein